MTTKWTVRHTLLTVGATLVFAACSGAATPGTASAPAGAAGSQPAAGSATPTRLPAASRDAGNAGPAEAACALVTKDEVATAAGFSIAKVSGGGGTCLFQNADPSQIFAVTLFTSQAGMAPYLNVEAEAHHVAGLGDDAFWAGTSGFMFVRKGDRALLFLDQAWVMTPDTDTAHLDSMVTLTRAALPNL